MLNIYLSGAMTYFHQIQEFERATQWRKEARERLNEIAYVFDPCACDPFKVYDQEDLCINDIVDQNLYFLKKADVVLCCTDHIEKSPGSLFELAYAKINGYPVISFDNGNGKPLDMHKNGYYTYLAGTHFSSFDDAIDYLLTAFSWYH